MEKRMVTDNTNGQQKKAPIIATKVSLKLINLTEKVFVMILIQIVSSRVNIIIKLN